jgi:hypothetical protein
MAYKLSKKPVILERIKRSEISGSLQRKIGRRCLASLNDSMEEPFKQSPTLGGAPRQIVGLFDVGRRLVHKWPPEKLARLGLC